MLLSPLGCTYRRTTSGVACHHCPWIYTRLEDIGSGIPSLSLDNIHDRTMSGMACHHRLYNEHMVRWFRAWHAIIALGYHTYGRTTSGMACYHLPWTTLTVELRRRAMPSSPLGSTHGQTKSCIKCYHCPWEAHTVKLRRALHTIISLGQHKWSYNIGREMLSSPFASARGWTTSSVAGQYGCWTA